MSAERTPPLSPNFESHQVDRALDGKSLREVDPGVNEEQEGEAGGGRGGRGGEEGATTKKGFSCPPSEGSQPGRDAWHVSHSLPSSLRAIQLPPMQIGKKEKKKKGEDGSGWVRCSGGGGLHF